MAWITGTATDHRDMLDQLIEIVTSDHVSAVAIVSGGSGYSIDDIITITDGTRTHAATMRVTSVAAGVIDGIQMENNGAYTVDPDLTATTAHTVAPSGGLGATFDLTMESDRYTVERRAQEAVSATVATGGTGYTVGDQLTLTMDGNGVQGASAYVGTYGVLPVFEVTAVSGGAVTAVATLVTAGHLEVVPDVDSGTGGTQANVTGGTGNNDCVLTVTYQDVASTQEDVVILNAPGGGGSDDIRTAIRTFQATDTTGFLTCYNWQILGLVQYNALLPLHEQVEISPGIDIADGARNNSGGTYMVLKDNSVADMTFWVGVSNRRIVLICKLETAVTTYYSSMYLGLLNAFSTAALEPYPMWVQGCTNRDNAHWSDSQIGRITGLSDMFALSGSDLNGAGVGANGPACFRADAGAWVSFRNGDISSDGGSPNRAVDSDFTIWPTGLQSYTVENTYEATTRQTTTGVNFDDIVPTSGIPGTPAYKLRPTPNTGDDVRPLLPLTPVSTDNPSGRFVYQPLGELHNCYWISAADATTALTSEDIQKDGEVRYIVFQNGNQNQDHSFFAVKQE